MPFRRISRLLLVVAVAALPVSANAAILTYSFNLNGSQEVPPNTSPAVGSGTIVINDVAGLIDFTIIGLNLTSAFAASHIHGPAPAGSNAGVVYNLVTNADSVGPVVIGSPIPNSIGITGAGKAIGTSLAGQINAAPWNYYVNIHTTAFPGGEIRGQLAPIPEPATYGMLAGGLALLGLTMLRRRRHS